LTTRFPDIKIDEFVVMSNHVHGIVIVRNNEYGKSKDNYPYQ